MAAQSLNRTQDLQHRIDQIIEDAEANQRQMTFDHFDEQRERAHWNEFQESFIHQLLTGPAKLNAA
ncbi:MAG: hypothetical protein AAF493_24070 [Pseudomonadota bacterium]